MKILDVGLSRLRHGTDSTSGHVDLSGAGFLMGTIACMAPEQAANSRDVDERSDIYSLGCTLYFLLGGRHCFEGGSSVDQIVAHRQQPVPPLESPYGLVPDELAAVSCRMLAKQPGDRQASAKELIDELEACCVDPTISSSAATITRARPESDSVALNLTESDTCAAMSRAEIAGPRVGSLRGYITGSRVITGLFLILLAMPLWPTMKHILFGSNPNDTSKPDAVAVTDSSINGPPPAVAPFDAASARALQQAWAEHLGIDLEIHDERIGVDLILIPPGEFTMGSAPEEIARLEATFAHELLSEYQLNLLRSETPQRRIRITKPFYLSRTEVTLEQFAVFVDDSDYVTEPERSDRGSGMENGEWVRNQGDFFNWREIGEANTLLTDQHPVGNITWTDAMTYCRWCSRHGIVYRLPTEAEWEYSCRAGTETRWSWGNHLAAVHEFAALDHDQHTSEARITEPVGQRRPNPFGLFDMHGNQAEYCRDWYDAEAYAAGNMIDPPGPQYRHPRLRDFGDARVRRGGFITGGVLGTRSAARAMNSQDDPTSGGIRLLREVAIR